MIQINIKNYQNQIREITVQGHSGYSSSGSDIVCASVSSIVVTTVNALVRFQANIKYKENDGFVSIQVLEHNQEIDILITNMLDLLQELEKQYKQYIKINKEVSSC